MKVKVTGFKKKKKSSSQTNRGMSNVHDSLVSLFQEYGLDLVLEKHSSQLQTVLGIAGRSFPIFIQASEDLPKIEILTFFPFPLDQGQAADAGRLLHLLNNELKVPGLGLDEENGLVFFRTLTPLNPDYIRFLLQEIRQVCENYSDVIEAICVNRISFDELILQAQDLISKKNTD